jgi:spore cortex biosynthesis protein YabQ
MIENQAYLFLIFIINGILIGLLFDFFRILRKNFKTIDFITYIEDIIFWIITGLIVLYSIFTFNNGEIRGFIFLGIIFGSLIYLLTISKYIIQFFTKVITIIKMPFDIMKQKAKIIYQKIKNDTPKLKKQKNNIKN